MALPIFPQDILPSRLLYRLVPNSGYKMAPNNMVEVFNKGGALWEFSGIWRNVRYEKARILANFLDQLEGPSGEFLMWDSTHTQLGNWGGNVRVNGINQTGKTLFVDGATPNAEIAPVRDRFQLDDYLYSLTQPAIADANGECELHLSNPLMAIPNDNTLLATANPMCKMMLKDNKQGPDFSGRKLVVSDFTISGFMSMRR